MTLSASELSKYLSSKQRRPTIGRRKADQQVPLSFNQEQIWLHELIEPDLPLYHEAAALTYHGVLDVPQLERSLNHLIQRHEILRTNIELIDGIPYQRISPERNLSIGLVDLTGSPEELRGQEAHRLATQAVRAPFHLADGPLLRVLVAKLAAEEYQVFIALHHLIFDGVSIRSVFLPELIALYSAYRSGESPMLPPLELQYGDYACWQRQRPLDDTQSSLGYWKTQLADLPTLELATDRPRTLMTSSRGAVHTFALSAALTTALRDFSQQARTTLFSALCASLSLILGRYATSEDVPMGTMTAGRTHAEMEPLVGYFLNTFVLRADLSGEPGFREVVSRMHEVILSGLSHADAHFQDVVRELAAAGDRRTELIQVMIALQPPQNNLPPEWELDVFQIFNGGAKFELEEGPEQLSGRVVYKIDLFDSSTIERLIGHWMTLLEAALQQPDRSIWTLPILSAAEQQWLSQSLDRTQRSYPQLCLPELFARQVAETPDRIAIAYCGNSLSYRELDRRSTQLANYLVGMGFAADAVIALMLPRTPEMLVALLAILKVGAAYVPMDPTYPQERLAAMLLASHADLLLTESSLRTAVPTNQPILELDSETAAIARQPDAAVAANGPSLQSAAYVIFTSGSTGAPKGVEISHRALTNLLWSMKHEPGIQAEDRLLAVTSICFDISALELFLPLSVGARIELVSSEVSADPVALHQVFLSCQATIMQATPITWRMLIEDGWKGSPTCKILCGGEALSPLLASELVPRAVSLWNMYGPTETTIWSSCTRISDAAAPIALGEPIANTGLYILDAHRALVPVGVAGELYIGGDGLATGYWNNPEATNDRFVKVSFGGNEQLRLYRTGDRVIRFHDGSIRFLGRTDRQIKLRGFRIELGEIEQTINRLPGVQESVVLKVEDAKHEDYLAAYVVARNGSHLDLPVLRDQLAKLLPPFMRPAVFNEMLVIPRTPNGKLNRNGLPAPVRPETADANEAPRSGTEETLAELWSELLGIEHVTRDDDFFDLGGHSLLAARLMARIESRFGRRLALGTLVQAPTLAQLALVLEGHAVPDARVLKSGSSPIKNLIWIGSEPWVRGLANNLTDEYTLYSLTIPPELLPSFAPTYKLEEMARFLVGRIRDLRLSGPYFVGGFCKEALLAYEVAHQIRSSGDTVALLVLGDLFTPGELELTPLKRLRMRVRLELAHLSLHGRKALVSRWPAFLTSLRMRMPGFQAVRDVEGQNPEPTETTSPLLEALYQAELSYQIKPYPGKVLFLESSGDPDLPHFNTSDGWKELLHDYRVFTYPGEHLDFHKDSCLCLATAEMQEAIEAALKTSYYCEALT
jgi:amino acid adenylation domain-containing protein